ncbi:MAG: ABC-2 transporter permease [Clostridiales bacterium]|nr:ABC-2 transporter permease [Clostridiales bacterium]
MLGLLLKDFINLKRYTKIFGLFIFIYGFMAYTQKDASSFTSIFALLFTILTMSSYAYDEVAKWDVYALTMPISREEIVRSKYYLMLLLVALSFAFSTVFTIVLNFILGIANIYLGLEACYIAASVIVLFYSITLPIITKLGIEKARIIFFAVYMIPVVIGYFIKKAANAGMIKIPTRLLEISKIAIQYRFIVIPIVLLIALWISYEIAIRIYQKKEF